jgi:hypothetical protein
MGRLWRLALERSHYFVVVYSEDRFKNLIHILGLLQRLQALFPHNRLVRAVDHGAPKHQDRKTSHSGVERHARRWSLQRKSSASVPARSGFVPR